MISLRFLSKRLYRTLFGRVHSTFFTFRIKFVGRKRQLLRRIFGVNSKIYQSGLDHVVHRHGVRETHQLASVPRGSLNLLSIDVHISVIEDVSRGLNESCRLTRWSLSTARYFKNKRSSLPSPVRYLYLDKWKALDELAIRSFQREYRAYLETVDGAIVIYPPAFLELYPNEMPLLIMAATRYEFPYTSRGEDWARLDEKLRRKVEDGSAILVANNQGDADYLKFYTGLSVPVIPSVGDYVESSWLGGTESKLIYARHSRTLDYVRTLQRGRVSPRMSFIGDSRPFTWDDLSVASEILVVPQNVSTMFLFELATAGVPVAVPDDEWLYNMYMDGVALKELSFSQVEDPSLASRGRSGPADPEWPEFFEWWIARSDFGNKRLMPNVRRVSCLEEYLDSEPAGFDSSDVIRGRTSKLVDQRAKLVDDFLELTLRAKR